MWIVYRAPLACHTVIFSSLHVHLTGICLNSSQWSIIINIVIKVKLLTLLSTCLPISLNTPLPPPITSGTVAHGPLHGTHWSAHTAHNPYQYTNTMSHPYPYKHTMHPYQETHTITGQHHHHVLQHSEHNIIQHQHIRHTKEDQYKEDNMRTLHTKQLDYLYVQLDSLKKNMKYKQTSLAKVGQHTLVFSVIYHY